MIDKNKLTLVIGRSGRVGRELVPLMRERGYNVTSPQHFNLNLLDQYHLYKFNGIRPNYIINLAAKTTTIKLNQEQPASIYADTVGMNMNLLNWCLACSDYKPEKIINVISSCAYGENDILVEDKFLQGNVHPSVRAHGEAKKQVYLMSQFYRQQYGLPVTCVCFNNVAGNEDWSKPDTLKVLSALAKKFVDAVVNDSEFVEIWGTGVSWREFIHAHDAAVGLLSAFEKYDGDLLNIGTGEDIQITVLADAIKQLTGFKGQILYKGGQDGQLTKRLSTNRMKQYLGDIYFHDPVMIADKVIREYKEYLKGR